MRTDREQRELHKIRDLIADIKRRMFKWLGHAIRMYETSVANNIFESKLECRVNVRGPKDTDAKVKRRGPVSDSRDHFAPVPRTLSRL
jgi:hypothetical protein